MFALKETNFKFPKQTDFYRGKVRDVYFIDDKYLVMIVSDRISAFDVVLPKGVPYKGQILNQIANKFLDLTSEFVPNWKITSPHPMVTIGKKCKPFPVEMIIRGYLTGSAWRAYKSGRRVISGVEIPEGMKENQKFDKPIITPTTKAEEGHDQEISKQEIIEKGLVSAQDYEILEKYTYKLFEIGSEYAKKRNLILVDTKYEFGKCDDNTIVLIDEVHTPDSSRYFYLDDYNEKFPKGEKPKQLSKEFIRQYLIERGFMGEENQKMPEIPDEVYLQVSDRYIELYETITGEKFQKYNSSNLETEIYEAVKTELEKLL